MTELLAVCRVDKRGRITVPKAARERMGWKGGETLEFVRRLDGSYDVRKVRTKRAR